jgi:flagellar biosynthesis protein
MTGKITPRSAVALQYDGDGAPRVTAKGDGPIADKIIEIARQNGIAVEENPMLLQALSTVEIDEEIPIELYQAVAKVIAFVLDTSKAAR